MKSIVKSLSLAYTADDEPMLTLTLATSRQQAQEGVAKLKDVLSKGKQLDVEIKQHRKKRSLDANSMAWALIGKIAEAIQSSKEEVYIEMLKRYGQREEQLISVIAEGVPAIMRATNEHCTVVGESELNGKLFKHLAILIGSSQYDTKQMSILIDGIVSECRELGIETKPEEEIKSLVESWGRK